MFSLLAYSCVAAQANQNEIYFMQSHATCPKPKTHTRSHSQSQSRCRSRSRRVTQDERGPLLELSQTHKKAPHMWLLASMLLRLPILCRAGERACVRVWAKSFAYALMHAYLAAASSFPLYLSLPHNLCMCEIWRHITF